jgi:hypothetical protein
MRKSLIISILINVILLFILLTCRNSKPLYKVINDTTIDTVYVPHNIIIEKPGNDIPYVILDTVYLPSKIDTISVINDYFSKVVYTDTLDFNDFGNIVINDTLFKNRIHFRRVTSNLKEKIITINNTKTIIQESTSLWLYGADYNINLRQIEPSLMWVRPNKFSYKIGAGYDINNSRINYSIGLYRQF